MNLKKRFPLLLNINIVILYLIIIAGSVVRMTGSGMGCPDWPMCFGQYIPPTDVEQITWKPEASFRSGQMILHSDTLWVAKEELTTASKFDADQWEAYTEHDYTIFNPFHTWVEYINRLVTVLIGFTSLILLFVSWFYSRPMGWLSLLFIVFLLFQAWLGAVVVSSVLLPVRITLHMLFAFILIGVLLVMKNAITTYRTSSAVSRMSLYLLLLLIVQIVLGTQVREYVDDQVDIYGYEDKSMWLGDLPLLFYTHRTFSVVFLYLVFRYHRMGKQQGGATARYTTLVLATTIVAMLTGVVMHYLDFPIMSQPIHLVLASVLFGLLAYVWAAKDRTATFNII